MPERGVNPIWMKERKLVFFLQRWPSQRNVSRIKQRVKALTPRSRCHVDSRDLIAALNPVLDGWGRHFQTGNASDKFREVDRHVWWRLKHLRIKRKGRHLKPGEAAKWTEDYFIGLGLKRLCGTIRYPGAA